jgi:hypothetical protein
MGPDTHGARSNTEGSAQTAGTVPVAFAPVLRSAARMQRIVLSDQPTKPLFQNESCPETRAIRVNACVAVGGNRRWKYEFHVE